jgi:NAD(P)-dependent dehydrogenase (short-subunit alcohol dehydrogenase family)
MPPRTWLITGVSSGFGRELAEQLLDRGDGVVGTVRDTSKVSDLLRRHPDTFRAEVLDVTDTRAVRQVVDRSFDQLGRIDVIISNAGYGLFGAAEELTDEQVDHMIATNLTGSIQLVRAALPPTFGPRAAAASSRSPPTEARSPSPATRCTTPRNGALRGSWSRSLRRSPASASA